MSASAHFLLQHFDRLAEAPGGIAKLRALLMQLAVEGKLGTQNPKDEPAGKLRERIATEKKRLIAAGKLGRDKEWSQDEGSTPDFNLPASWVFSTLAEIGSINPRNEAVDDQDASFVPMKLINAELRQPHGHEVRKWTEIKKGFTHFAEGDVTLAKITPCFENRKSSVMRGLANGIGAGTTELHVVRPVLVDPDYILIFLKSPLFVEAGIPGMTGTAGQKRVPTSYFAATPFPLPPLAEQRRIVAKVEELMGLCDALEAAQQEREAVRTRLRTSALHQLASPDSDSKSAAFALQNLTNLINAPEDLALLRQSIFQLAISGGLLARFGPWKTARLDSVAECRLGKMLDAHKNTGRLTKYLRNTNVHWFRFELDSIKELKLEVEEFAEYEVHPGDVMICEGGHGIGRTAVWRGEIQGIIFQKALHRVRPKKDLHPDFFSYVMKVFYDTGVLSEFYTGAGIPHLTGQELKKITIPLPPLAEQRRIVAKVDELMAVLDALEATLTSARTTSEKLLAATIAKLHAA